MSLKIYASKNFNRYFNSKTKNQVIKENLEFDTINNGVIAVDSKSGGFGVFDKNLKIVKSSLQLRNTRGQFIPNNVSEKDIPYFDFDVIYLGNMVSHFGHFILEHTNRMWINLLPEFKKTKVVFVMNRTDFEIPDFIFEILQMSGIKSEDIIILNQTSKFKNVIIPHQGFNIPVYSSRNFGETFDNIAGNTLDDKIHDKIYLSRVKMGVRNQFGEKRLEQIFENNGYKIIYPETLKLDQQISLVKNCTKLAGLAGTALHLGLFMRRGCIIQLRRNTMPKCNAPIQYLINKTKNLNSVFIDASMEKVRTDHFTDAPQIVGITKYMKKFMDENGFKYKDSDLEFDKDSFDKYQMAILAYKKLRGNIFIIKIKKNFIKFSSLVIVGRINRNKYRKYLKHKFNLG